ncbi:MAG: PAS domain S-box protein [Bacteroidales bacterium]|nr:PAS domain S-box protein [Bacteroidales bacterium]
MIIRSITIRSKLLLTTLVIVLLLVVLALTYMDAARRAGNEQVLLEERSALQSEYHSLNTTFHRMVLDEENGLTATCIHQARQVEDRLRNIIARESLSQEAQINLKSEQIFTTLKRIRNDLRIPVVADSTHWMQARTDMEVLGGLMTELDRSLTEFQNVSRRKGQLQIGLALSLGIFLIGTYLVIFSLSITNSFRKLSAYTSQLQSGKLPLSLDLTSENEFGRIARNLNSHTADLQEKIGHITSLSQEGPGAIYKPDENDELGNALLVLSDYLTSKELDEVTRNREDKKQNWISEGMAQLGEVLQSERENVIELSYRIIQKLVTYMNVEMGSIFITNDTDPENPSLDLAASYAFDRRKYMNSSLPWGVGLPGTCAQEKERIFLTEVPDDYFEVSSGTGSSKPNCILLVPLKIDDEVYGVIELATVRLLRPFETEFVESLAESIASSLLTVRINERTSELLKQSQGQSETLKSQETAMLENMKQLEQTQEESSKKETEFTEILNAINQSSLVAELGLNSRFSSINDQFLLLLESHRDQVLGKLYSEFAKVDPYSDGYKEFWSSLREGRSISNIETYKLFSGKEVWLQQTLTPIINNEGKVYKILNIAMDITENRMLQERLESRELEITRSGLDMQTLNEAVNSSLIKCELDAEGIIIDVNDKYNEVTGYGRKELLGRNYRMFLKDSEKDQFEKIWDEVIKEKVYEGVIRRSKPTGEEVWLISTFSPVKDEAGAIYKVYFMGLDITEKKLKYQLLEDANQEVERLKERLKNDEA